MIVTIIEHATQGQLDAAVRWTSDQLHVPEAFVEATVAVAYVVRHYRMGQLEGWDGFVEDIGG